MAKKKKKSPTRASMMQTKINQLKTKMEELRQCRALLAEEGIEPDQGEREQFHNFKIKLEWLEKDRAKLKPKDPNEEKEKAPKKFYYQNSKPGFRKPSSSANRSASANRTASR